MWVVIYSNDWRMYTILQIIYNHKISDGMNRIDRIQRNIIILYIQFILSKINV